MRRPTKSTLSSSSAASDVYKRQYEDGIMKFENIRNLREDNDKTQKEVAAYLNIKQTTYSKYELGKINVPIDVFIKLADYYTVSIDYLVGRGKKWNYKEQRMCICLLYTSDAADEEDSVYLGGRRLTKKKKNTEPTRQAESSEANK